MDDPETNMRLAILGAPPAFAAPLHVGRPNVGNRQHLLSRLTDMLDRRWFTNNGPFVEEFERRIGSFVGAKHVICVCNATIGLEIVARAAELSGEVIVPANTFVATAHALQWQGITPVFADVDPATHNIDPAAIERHLTPRTSGIVATHVWGRPCDIEGLQNIAAQRGLILIFDAAHAFGCSYRGAMIGSFGIAEVFSFHATKFLNSFEGGAICTNDDALAQKARLMTNFGFAGFDRVVHVGINGKMSEPSAAMGLTSLESVADIVSVNEGHWRQYCRELQGVAGVSVVQYDERERCNYQYIVLEIDSAAGLERDWLLEILRAENVVARRYFYPGVHRMEPYRSARSEPDRELARTDALLKRLVVLPTGTAIASEDITKICRIVRVAVENSARLMDRLRGRVRAYAPPLA